MQAIQDKSAPCINGFIAILVAIALLLLIYFFSHTSSTFILYISSFIFILFFSLSGFTIINPNEAKVITFFGKYIGTIKHSGFIFTIPFTNMIQVPLKLVNFNTDHLKVNDLNGNPIEIGAVVVWHVTDAAQASFNVDDYVTFVGKQSDIAIRTLAAHYPYDSEKETSLRANVDEIAAKLKDVLQTKLSVAGIVVEEIKLSHIAYAPEIASAMLKRQQAAAIFQARQYMVENTLAIIDAVMQHFDKTNNVKFSDEKKADLVNSLLIVMTSDKESSPVINMGK